MVLIGITGEAAMKKRGTMTDFSNKTDVEIDQWIVNFEKRAQTEPTLYLELLEERGRRAGRRPGLDMSVDRFNGGSRV